MIRINPCWIFLEILALLSFLVLSYLIATQRAFLTEENISPQLYFASPEKEAKLTPSEKKTFSSYSVKIVCLTEENKALPSCLVEINNETFRCDSKGHLKLKKLTHPVVAVARKEGFLPEPFLIGKSDAGKKIPIVLWKAENRLSIHLSGDVMFGRRYLEDPYSPRILIAKNQIKEDSISLVQHLARAFACADFGSVNLESVCSNLSENQGYPKKRFLINSPPKTLYALKKMNVQLVNLANNHIYDFLDKGVAETLKALKEAQIYSVGGGTTAKEAAVPFQTTIKGNRIAVLGFTTVNGDAVNSHYPTLAENRPANSTKEENWLWEKREWGFDSSFLHLPKTKRRLGDVWNIFIEKEKELSEQETSLLWNSLRNVYPELQDWVARRGHGGANHWISEKSPQQIKALKKENDLVLLHIHSGYQFTEAPSERLRSIAYDAIDAGADLVFAHHPHILQGIEWYKGKLICFSFGNGIFEQKFFSSFHSAFLRTIWENGKLLQTKIYPIELENYVPVPVTDKAAQHIIGTIFERSMWKVNTVRHQKKLSMFSQKNPPKETENIGIKLTQHTATLTPPISPQKLSFKIKPNKINRLPSKRLYSNQVGGTTKVFLGKDLLKWGHFEDLDCDTNFQDLPYWKIRTMIGMEIKQEKKNRFVTLHRSWFSQKNARLSPVSRIPIKLHRFYQFNDSDKATPLDSLPQYTFQFRAQKKGRGLARIRLKGYFFDDTDPTKMPLTQELSELSLEIPLQETNSFQSYQIEIPPEWIVKNGPTLNFLFFFFELEPFDSELALDDVHFIEWREANKTPYFEQYQFIKSESPKEHTVELNQLSWETQEKK